MDQAGSENGENQINLRYSLEIKPTGYGGKLNMGEKKTKKSKKRIWFEQPGGFTEIRKTRDSKRSDWKCEGSLIVKITVLPG